MSNANAASSFDADILHELAGDPSSVWLGLLVDQFPTVIWTTDLDLRFTSSQGNGLSLMNLRSGQVVGMTIQEAVNFGPAELAPHYRALAGESVAVEQVVFGRTYQTYVQPLRDAREMIVGTLGIALDITQRKQAELEAAQARRDLELRVSQRTAELSDRTAQLQAANAALEREVREHAATVQALLDNRQYLSGILNSQQTFIVRGTTARTISFLNDAYARATGLKLGDTYDHILHPDDAGLLAEARAKLTKPPYTFQLESRCLIGGEWRWIDWQGSVIRDRDGVAIETQAVGFDITARREAEEALRKREVHFRELAQSNRRLLNEVDHRVRNNLSGLLALIDIMRGSARAVEEFAVAMRARLLAMAHIHQVLGESGWNPVELRSLLVSLLAKVREMAPFPATLQCTGPDVRIPPAQSQPLVLIILEWFTNSCKYGAHAQPGGTIGISWRCDPGESNWCLKLQWTEAGGPPIKSVGLPSLGTELVRGFAARELNGRVSLSYPETGAQHVLEFPLSSSAGPGELARS